jgi:inorganic pyrophosphatase
MATNGKDPLWKLLGLLHKSHPWHGIEPGDEFPAEFTSFVEIVPTDTVKYEIDKITGHLMVDRPQTFSSLVPCLYGFVPQTLCAARVAAFTQEQTGRVGMVGDGDPIDICILTENRISRGDIQVTARPIGGIRLVDKGEVDDKIIAVLKGDAAFGKWEDIGQVPDAILERLKHYFVSYKRAPDAAVGACEILGVYDAAAARRVLVESRKDYLEQFGDIEGMLHAALYG